MSDTVQSSALVQFVAESTVYPSPEKAPTVANLIVQPALPAEVTAENVEEVLQTAGCHGPNYGLLSKAGVYDENFAGDGKIFPGSDAATDFPMEEIVSRLDGGCGESASQNDNAVLADAMSLILKWIAGSPKAEDQRAVKSVGIRALAAIWVINPKIFGDCAAHLVAEKHGVSPAILKTNSAEFSRTLKIQNRFQLHDWQNQRRAIL